jgi:hypothetical protein
MDTGDIGMILAIVMAAAGATWKISVVLGQLKDDFNDRLEAMRLQIDSAARRAHQRMDYLAGADSALQERVARIEARCNERHDKNQYHA